MMKKTELNEDFVNIINNIPLGWSNIILLAYCEILVLPFALCSQLILKRHIQFLFVFLQNASLRLVILAHLRITFFQFLKDLRFVSEDSQVNFKIFLFGLVLILFSNALILSIIVLFDWSLRRATDKLAVLLLSKGAIF